MYVTLPVEKSEDNSTEAIPTSPTPTHDGEPSKPNTDTNPEVSTHANETEMPSSETKQKSETKEMIDCKVVYNKRKYDISFALDESVTNLKQHLETLTGIVSSYFCFQNHL